MIRRGVFALQQVLRPKELRHSTRRIFGRELRQHGCRQPWIDSVHLNQVQPEAIETGIVGLRRLRLGSRNFTDTKTLGVRQRSDNLKGHDTILRR